MQELSKIICNIPHAGTDIPKWARSDIIINENELKHLLEFMTDKSVDKIWDFVPSPYKMVASVS